MALAGDQLVVEAAAGKAHQLTIGHRDGYVVVADSVPVTAGAGCVAVKETEVQCLERDVKSIAVKLPELADTLSYRGALPLTASGGGGDDVLTGGFGPDTLYGGPGKDKLYGGPGDDKLYGGDGRDYYSGGTGNDTMVEPSTDPAGGGFDGGSGDDKIVGSVTGMRDLITYGVRTTSVVVDLAAGTGGEANIEQDLISHIEDVDGGSGDDKIVGDAGNNILRGNLGYDRISGGGGIDGCQAEEHDCI